jgi:hypothetical protein
MVSAGMTIDWVICKSCLCPELLFAQGLALAMTKHYIPIWECVKHRKGMQDKGMQEKICGPDGTGTLLEVSVPS